ncbi:DUF6359 domain-containing protein [Saccharicrinis aurantiacus]|uniref:DUF6359 domain-containing protein n=1 Tax=Saccharicrinis aurantiacus TaxID=1849719 RepID=UPI000837EA12|nr:DUF6359 domain-containing protein [Saccharicrinis aurantiacus]
MNRLKLTSVLCMFLGAMLAMPLSANTRLITNGDGSAQAPLSVTQVLEASMDGTKNWVQGYIVGAAINSPMTEEDPESYSFEVPYGKNTNILIADNPNETDVNKCVPVELSPSYRPLISIDDNHDFKNKKITVYAKLERYYQVNGLKGLSDYSFPNATIVLNLSRMSFGQVMHNNTSEPIEVEITPFEIEGTVNLEAPEHFEVSLTKDGNYTSNASFNATTNETTTAYFRFAPNNSVAGDIYDEFTISGGSESRIINVYGFAGEGDAKGSENNPYSVSEVRQNQGIGHGWGEGYIVGIPDDGPVYYWDAEDGEWLHTKGLILADNPNERNPHNVILIRLTDTPNTQIRNDVNLKDNPELYAQKIKFGGSLATYYGVPAIITIDNYSFDVQTEYTINYNVNGGEAIEDDFYTADSETFLLPIPTKTDYVFEGWFNNASLEGDEIKEVVTGSAGNLFLHAAWGKATNIDADTENTYTIFPIPFNTNINVSNIDADVAMVELIDITGSVINQKTANDSTISFNTAKLSNGIYFIRITKTNGTSITQKVLK